MTQTPDPVPPHTSDEDEGVDRAQLLGLGGRWLSDWALRVAILLGAGWILHRIGATLWVGILPMLLALIVSTVLWPPVRWMTARKVPAALASLVAIVGAFGLLAGILALIAPSVVRQAPQLADAATEGVKKVQAWAEGSPLNIRSEQIDAAVQKVTGTVQSQSESIATGVFSGVAAVGSVVVTLLLVLVLTFFFIKDGPAFLPWVRRIVGRGAGRHVTEVLTRSWKTLSGYIWAQATVSMVDAVFIGIGLVILQVPLAGPLAILTFLGGFIPIVGAFTMGALAVLVALVTQGPTTALLVLGLVVLVQQLEGNVLSPLLQSRAMELHPVVVLLSVAAGAALYGIVGAFLAVPLMAVVAVVLRYIGEQVDLRTGEVTAQEVRALTHEGRLAAWLGEMGATRFRPRGPRRGSSTTTVTGDDDPGASVLGAGDDPTAGGPPR